MDTKLWVPDAEQVWRLAEVESKNESTVTVFPSRDGEENETFELSNTYEFDESHASDLDDATKDSRIAWPSDPLTGTTTAPTPTWRGASTSSCTTRCSYFG